jgi:hypothetical protein
VLTIAEELAQMAPDAPNIIAISFFGAFPSELARDWAFKDLFSGAVRYGRSTNPATRMRSTYPISNESIPSSSSAVLVYATFTSTQTVPRRSGSLRTTEREYAQHSMPPPSSFASIFAKHRLPDADTQTIDRQVFTYQPQTTQGPL